MTTAPSHAYSNGLYSASSHVRGDGCSFTRPEWYLARQAGYRGAAPVPAGSPMTMYSD